jgi:hypothetical protein
LVSVLFLIFSSVSVWGAPVDYMPLVVAVLDFFCAIGHSTTDVANDSFQNEKDS